MPELRLTVCHNKCVRGGHYQPGDRLTAVYSRDLPPAWSSCTPDLLAESLFWTFRVTGADRVDQLKLTAEDQKLNSVYRNRRLRPFVVGDVLVLGNQAFACEPHGRALLLDLNLATIQPTARKARHVKETVRA